MIPEKEDVNNILLALKTETNYDLSNYSFNSLSRRFGKVIIDFKMTPSEIVENIQEDSSFVEKLIKKITVNTTELFRDPEIWQNLHEIILPQFSHKKEIKIWHPGCSTGQEVYSMMIVLDSLNLLEKTKIYASDINTDVMETAKAGEYKFRFNKNYLKNYDKSINYNKQNTNNYDNYFTLDEIQDKIIMKKFLREKPFYKKQDLVKDENLFDEKFDLIICRNVIIYFNYELQNKVLNFFYNNMNEPSCLILGIHESIIGLYSGKYLKKNSVYFKN